MKLVNETGQQVAYWVSSQATGVECGYIEVNGLVDLPQYDNQTNVYVGFQPTVGMLSFGINCDNTGTDEEVEMRLIVE